MEVNDMKTIDNITISLGKPVTAPCLIPVLHASTPNCVSEPFMVNGEEYKVTALSFGTPHGVVIVDDVESVDVPSLGSSLGMHARFPKGASIVFVQVIDRESVKARLWQRGEGETAFTPEAACASVAASRMLQKIMVNKANVLMGGNTMQVEWDRIGDIMLTGPADLLKS
jgi:diaminopimelate epimerase